MASEAIYRLCYPHLRRWFMCRLSLDSDNNFDVTILTTVDLCITCNMKTSC